MASKRSLSQSIRDGGRFYFDNPSVDQALAMILTLSGEVWAQRERLATLESAAGRKGLVAPGELERHEFSEAEEFHLAALRKEFLANLFGILENNPRVSRTGAARTTGDRKPAARGRAAKKPARKK